MSTTLISDLENIIDSENAEENPLVSGFWDSDNREEVKVSEKFNNIRNFLERELPEDSFTKDKLDEINYILEIIKAKMIHSVRQSFA